MEDERVYAFVSYQAHQQPFPRLHLINSPSLGSSLGFTMVGCCAWAEEAWEHTRTQAKPMRVNSLNSMKRSVSTPAHVVNQGVSPLPRD